MAKQKLVIWSRDSISRPVSLELFCENKLKEGWEIQQIIPKRRSEYDQNIISAYILLKKDD